MYKRTVDYEPIIALLREGHGPAFIIEKLGLKISKRWVQRIAVQNGIVRPHQTAGRLDSDHYTSPIRDIILHALIELRGLDPHVCSDCGAQSKQMHDIHHTKYEGATIYDLAFLCRKCNTSPRNVGLS